MEGTPSWPSGWPKVSSPARQNRRAGLVQPQKLGRPLRGDRPFTSLPESEQERFAQLPWELDPREGGTCQSNIAEGFAAMKTIKSTGAFIEPFCDKELQIIDNVHSANPQPFAV